jgi:hypothetical protein
MKIMDGWMDEMRVRMRMRMRMNTIDTMIA